MYVYMSVFEYLHVAFRASPLLESDGVILIRLRTMM